MKSKEFLEFAQKMFEAGLPFLVEGKPGMAKTALIELAAEAAGMDCIVSHPAVRSPIDYGGIPAQIKASAGKKNAEWDFVPIGDLRRLCNATKPTVFFMDDFGQGSTATQNAVSSLIHSGQIGENKISDQVRICAATNSAEHKAGVNPILEHIKSRFTTIVRLDEDVDGWLNWASTIEDIGLRNSEEPMPPVLVAFIAWKRSLLYGFEPKPGLENTPTPRTVHHVGQLLAAGAFNESTAFEVITGAVGKGFATEFMAFLKIYAHLPDPEAVLQDPDYIDQMMFEQYGWDETRQSVVAKGTTSVKNRPDVAYALITSVADIVEPKQMMNYTRLLKKFQKPVEVLGMLLVKQRGDKFLETRAFIQWAKDNQAYMM